MNKIDFLQNNVKFLLPNNSTKKINFTSKPDDFSLSEDLKQRKLEAKEEVEEILSDSSETLSKEEKEKTINDMVRYNADFYTIRHVAKFSDENEKSDYINLIKKIENTIDDIVNLEEVDELINKGLDKKQILNLYSKGEDWVQTILDNEIPDKKKEFMVGILDDKTTDSLNYSSFSSLINCSEDVEEIKQKFEESKKLYEEIGQEKVFYIDDAIKCVLMDLPKEEIKEIVELTSNHSTLNFNTAKSLLENYTKEEIENAFKTGEREKIGIKDAIKYNKLYETVDEEKNEIAKSYPRKLSPDELKEKYEGEVDWKDTIYDNYSQLRKIGKYTINYGKENFVDKIGDIRYNSSILSRKSGMKIANTDSWNLRYVKRNFDKNNVYRASLNVKACSDLINKLDNLLRKEKNFEYKLPSNVINWGLREDPVTIYFYGKPSEELKNKITEITKPYKRGDITSEKNSDTPWIAFEKNPSEKEINELLDEIKNTNEDFYKEIVSDGKDKLTSLGYFNACKMTLQQYQEYLKTAN